MDFLTLDLIKKHCRIEDYSKDPERQRKIDDNIKTQANKAEQKVYEYIGRNYFDIIKEWGKVPLEIKVAALILTSRGLIKCPYEDGNVIKMMLQPYKKK